jgi:hypothetical protein
MATEVQLDEEKLEAFVERIVQMIVPTVTVAPQVAEAFKSGRGVTQDQYLGAPASVPAWARRRRASLLTRPVSRASAGSRSRNRSRFSTNSRHRNDCAATP